ncbi:hypothetical protein ACKQTC_07210 [Peptococcus simiae]|uniref:Uncharacterized protein n=1 Tax=Peptococcus simiae TaxID=1643805 RepID=A0ABW9H1C7_9FIRM
MAKILDTAEQKEALREITEGLKVIQDIDKVLASSSPLCLGILSDNKLKISLDTHTSESGQVERLLGKLRAKIAKKIPAQADKYHIGLSEEERTLISGPSKEEKGVEDKKVRKNAEVTKN